MNVFRNYAPNKYITIDDKDPIWINKIIKSKIKTKNLLFKQYIQNRRLESDFVFLEALITEIDELISSTKNLYYENLARKVNIPLLQAKTYWTILKTFYNEKKIPIIPPLLIDDNFCNWYPNEGKHFQYVFAEQCTPITNSSILPANTI